LHNKVISLYSEFISQLNEKLVEILIKNFKRDW